MKTLLIRSVTGAVYVGLTVGSILLGSYTFCMFFALLMCLSLFEFYRIFKNGGFRPQIIAGLLLALFMFLAFFLYDAALLDYTIFFALVPVILSIPVIELFRRSERPIRNMAITSLGIVYISIPFALLVLTSTPYANTPSVYSWKLLLGLFILIWANDSGAYLIGSLWGRTKMIERISPNKTWEGAIGGGVVATIIAVFYFNYFDLMDIPFAIGLALVTVIAGTLGDLTESMIKRHFHIKDSGHLMPGHGGMLDRLDSMLLAAPVYYVYVSLVVNLA